LLFTRIEPELFSNFDPFSVPIFFVVYEALNATPLTYAILLYWHLSNSSITKSSSKNRLIGFRHFIKKLTIWITDNRLQVLLFKTGSRYAI
jgi:hypothetical protein